MPHPLPVFDGHNDVLTKRDHAQFVAGRRDGHLDLPRMRAAGMRGGIFSVHTPSRGPWQDPKPVSHVRAASHASAVAGRLLTLEQDGHLRVAREIADFDQAIADDGPPLAVLHLEGAEAIDPALDALEFWRAAGLRSLGPVWSRPNAFGHGVPFVFPSSPDTGPGLTDAGRALVDRCAQLGIMVDLSHLNEAGFWDVARIEPGPLVATHSGAHRLSQTSRNLTDDQLDAIGASGGLVGIVFASAFLREDFGEDRDTPIELIASHARYVADRIGVEHVALGSDFDGTVIPDAVGDVAGLPRVLDALAAGGFDQGDLAAIAHANWRRVLAAWWER
jgi:membrane dipeptidase